MKKSFCIFLALMLLLLSACQGGTPETPDDADTKQNGESGVFMAGFAKVDITPEQPVHLASYGDSDTRIMEGVMHPLELHTLALRDTVGKTVVIITTDLSWGNAQMLLDMRPRIEEAYGLKQDEVFIGGIHNHNAPDYGYADTYDQIWQEIFIQAVVDSVGTAIADLAPATITAGRTETENLTFVRRYLLANGDWSGDNSNYNHNSTIVSHETEADEEVQLVRLVRGDGHKDIIMVNWQAHAAKHGHTRYLSADYAGPLRDKVEKNTGAYCVFYQGACGNLNPSSRISGECVTGMNSYENAVMHGELVADVVLKALNTEGLMKEIPSGKVLTSQTTFITDSSYDEANAIACGGLSFVTLPAEFFDVLGKQIKDETPFEMTVLLGFHCGRSQYLASYEGYLHGGYEPTNTRYRAGDGEKFVAYYLDRLHELYDQEQ